MTAAGCVTGVEITGCWTLLTLSTKCAPFDVVVRRSSSFRSSGLWSKLLGSPLVKVMWLVVLMMVVVGKEWCRCDRGWAAGSGERVVMTLPRLDPDTPFV